MSKARVTEHQAARTARAVTAAVGAGRELGLTVTDPVVLHDVFSMVVHLAPAPVAVRVPTVTPPYLEPDLQAARQQVELDVVAWLRDQGCPVVPPSPLVPRKPVRRDGFSMTFWELVTPDTAAEPDYVQHCRLVADLHAALRDYPGELPYLSAAEPRMVEEGFAALGARPDLISPAELVRAQREWEILAPIVGSRAAFEARFPGVGLQPIHGDAPAANIIRTPGGPLYSDFELVTYGPAEWDVAFFGAECEAAYNEAAQRRGLRSLDQRVLRFVDAVGMSRIVACLALVPRLPVLAEALAPSLEHWRNSPPITDDLFG